MALLCLLFFFFKQKTAYEMRISDWSSDVCSSDLCPANIRFRSISPPWAMSCSVFWMQKLRGSASRPVEFVSLSAQEEKLHWLRQPMQSAWSVRIIFFSSGVTKTSVLSGVFRASTKPMPYHYIGRASCRERGG